MICYLRDTALVKCGNAVMLKEKITDIDLMRALNDVLSFIFIEFHILDSINTLEFNTR